MHDIFTTIQKPYFTMLLNAEACDCQVRVNGVPVEDVTGSVSTELPLNQWIFPEKNQVAVYLGEELQDRARLTIALQVREIDGGFEDSETFSGLQITAANGKPSVGASRIYPGSEVAQVGKDPAGKHVASRTFLVAAPFGPWLWSDSDEIADNEATFQALWNLYKQFHGFIRQQDRAAVEAAMEQALNEYMAGYYIAERSQALTDFEIPDLMTDPSANLAELDRDEVRLQIFGNNRLARLVDLKGESPVKFVQGAIDVHVDLMYCKHRGNWVQIR